MLEANKQQQGVSSVELDQSRVGRLSRMDAMQSHEMSLDAKRRQLLDLQRISVALEKIDAGDYGLCEECDEEIASGRLEIDPATQHCVGCAALLEKKKAP